MRGAACHCPFFALSLLFHRFLVSVSVSLFVSLFLVLCIFVYLYPLCFIVSLSLSLCRFLSLFRFFLVSVVRAYFSIYLFGFNCIFGHRGVGGTRGYAPYFNTVRYTYYS